MLCYSWVDSQEHTFSEDTPPRRNFHGYELLTLRTKLYPFVHEEYGYDKEIRYSTRNQGPTRKIVLQLYDGAKVHKLSKEDQAKLQHKIDTIIAQTSPEYACVFSYNHFIRYQKKYPSIAWIQTVLKYIELGEKYEAYVTDDGLYAKVVHSQQKYKKGNILLPEEYVETLGQAVEKQLLEMYRRGTIYQPTSGMVRDWSLEMISSDEQLYQTTWHREYRLVGEIEAAYDSVTDFLLALLKGAGKIYLRIGANNARRHLASSFLNSMELKHVYLSFYLVLPALDKDFLTMIILHLERLFTETDFHVVSHDKDPKRKTPPGVVTYYLADGRTIVSKRIPFHDSHLDYQDVYEEVIDYRDQTPTPFLLPEEVSARSRDVANITYAYNPPALPAPKQDVFWSQHLKSLLTAEKVLV